MESQPCQGRWLTSEAQIYLYRYVSEGPVFVSQYTLSGAHSTRCAHNGSLCLSVLATYQLSKQKQTGASGVYLNLQEGRERIHSHTEAILNVYGGWCFNISMNPAINYKINSSFFYTVDHPEATVLCTSTDQLVFKLAQLNFSVPPLTIQYIKSSHIPVCIISFEIISRQHLPV